MKKKWFKIAGYFYSFFQNYHLYIVNIFCKKWFSFQVEINKILTKGCLSLFNYFIDRRPTLMSPFFVEKTCFFDKKWTD